MIADPERGSLIVLPLLSAGYGKSLSLLDAVWFPGSFVSKEDQDDFVHQSDRSSRTTTRARSFFMMIKEIKLGKTGGISRKQERHVPPSLERLQREPGIFANYQKEGSLQSPALPDSTLVRSNDPSTSRVPAEGVYRPQPPRSRQRKRPPSPNTLTWRHFHEFTKGGDVHPFPSNSACRRGSEIISEFAATLNRSSPP